MANNKLPEFLWVSKEVAKYKDIFQDPTTLGVGIHYFIIKGGCDFDTLFDGKEMQSIRLNIEGVNSISHKPVLNEIKEAADLFQVDYSAILKGAFSYLYENRKTFSIAEIE
ncbi:hypothetical protein V4V51_003765 [Vibrio mimicus]